MNPEQRAELAASQPAAAIEGLRPFTVKHGRYLAFMYDDSKIHGPPPAEADSARSIKLRLTRAQLPDLD
jgi:hypothetical protein